MSVRLRALLLSCSRKLRLGKREIFVLSVVVAVTMVVAHPALAEGPAGSGGNDILHQAGLLIGNICLIVTKFLGSLLLLATDSLLIRVSSYNGFVTSGAVDKGWVIVRDLTNMFFVLMMLIVSIGTILGVEEFSYRRLLPRLLIMAVLINFSKVIVGIFVDLSQVVMLTFVNGYSAAAGGNILQLFKLKELLTDSDKIGENTATDITDYVGAQFLAMLMMAIALFIVVIMSLMLAFRIVMIWILTILSPLAFFLSTFPRGKAQAAYSRWWELFGNYVVSGPLLAFFLWLAFSVTAAGDIGNEISNSAAVQEAPNQYFFTEAGASDVFTSYIIGVSLLLAGMYITADLGVAAGGMLRGGADWLKGSAQRLAKGAMLLPLRAGIGGAKVAGRAAGAVAGKAGKFGEAQVYAKTGLMVPFSERAKKRRKELDEAYYKRLEDKGGEKREAGFRGGGAAWYGFRGGRNRVDKAVQAAAKGRDEIAKIESDKEMLLRRPNDMRAGAESARANSASLRADLAGDSFEMNGTKRGLLRQRQAEFVAQEAAIRQQAGQALGAEKTDLLAQADKIGERIATAIKAQKAADGDSVRWDAGGPDFKQTASTEADRLSAEADSLDRRAAQEQVMIEPAIADRDRQIAAMLPGVEKAEERAKTLRERRMDSPEARWLRTSVGKAEREAVANLPPDMTPRDRLDTLARAFERGDKHTVKVVLQKMATEGELEDALVDSSQPMGGKYGTDTDSIATLTGNMQRGLGMTAQEARRTLNDVFQTAAAKGETRYHAKFVQDARTGSVRIASDADNSVPQVKKLEKKSGAELLRNDNVSAVFNVSVDQDGNVSHPISDAGLIKVASSQEKILEELGKNRIHPKMLTALKENEGKLREAVNKGLLNSDFMDRLSAAVARKTISATELAKKWKGRL